MRCALLALAFALLGCSGFDDQVTSTVAYNARAGEFLQCGWALSYVNYLDPGPTCWGVTPPPDGTRAVSLVDDACAAQTDPLPLVRSDRPVYEWLPLVGDYHSPVSYEEIACPVTDAPPGSPTAP